MSLRIFGSERFISIPNFSKLHSKLAFFFKFLRNKSNSFMLFDFVFLNKILYLSIISRKSNDQSVSFAEKSLDLSLKYFTDFLSNPNNQNTCAMLLAANLSGEAISISKTTAPHAVSYPFTSLFNISHGHAVSLTINKFISMIIFLNL